MDEEAKTTDWFPTLRRLRPYTKWFVAFVVVASVITWYVRTEHHRHTIDVNGATREYLLHVPSYRGNEQLPLVLAYHGFSGSASGMERSSRLHELAARERFFLVYMEGRGTWRIGTEEVDSPDIQYFDAVTAELIARYPIDVDRVYVTGMSLGGDFAIRLAGRRSERIAAVVSQGFCPKKVVDAIRPFPLMIIAGTKDDRVPASCFPGVPDAFRQRGHVVEVVRPAGVQHRWHVPMNNELWTFLSAHRRAAEATE